MESRWTRAATKEIIKATKGSDLARSEIIAKLQSYGVNGEETRQVLVRHHWYGVEYDKWHLEGELHKCFPPICRLADLCATQ